MKKTKISFFILFTFLLSGCETTLPSVKFKILRDDSFIYENKVLINYRTNEQGQLTLINIDRLLTLEDLLFAQQKTYTQQTLTYAPDDIFIFAKNTCTNYNNLEVPYNLTIGISAFKYNVNECKYQEVDRNNVVRQSTFLREYALSDTIPFNYETLVKVATYDPTTLNRFVSLSILQTTIDTLGIYANRIVNDQTFLLPTANDYHRDMTTYEQVLLKYQDQEYAENEVMGISNQVNLFDLLNSIVRPVLIVDFSEVYSLEQSAIAALYSEIQIIEEETIEETINSSEQ